MPELQRLRADHAPAVLAFELANRAYFAASISDRGDEYYDQFTARHSALLAEQEAGIGAFYVLVAEDGAVLGRFNLLFAGDGTAKLGYRVAQRVAGRGVATAAVQELCHVAAVRYGLRTLRAAAARENAASQKVLAKAGFMVAGPADPADVGGKPGTWYQRDLVLQHLGVAMRSGRGRDEMPDDAGYPRRPAAPMLLSYQTVIVLSGAISPFPPFSVNHRVLCDPNARKDG